MQGRKIAIFLVMIFVISIIPITKIGINRAETITSSVKWSGVKEINDDVIIKSGAQLIIEDGAIININSDISISVEGVLIIEGTGLDGVKIIANISQQSELGLKSSWEGIQIQSTGTAEINGMSLNGSRIGVIADVGGILNLQNSTISDSIQGIVNLGTSEITELYCVNIQNNCINNDGIITVMGANSNNTGVLLKHTNSGTISELVAINTGVVVEVSGTTSGSIESINATNTGLILRAYGDQSGMTYSDINANTATQLFDLTNSMSLTIDDIQGTSIDSLLLANSADALEISNMQIYDTQSVLLAMNIATSGSVSISDTTISGYSQTFSFSGGGDFILDETTFQTNGKVGQLSSSSTLSINGGEWSGASGGLYTQHSSLIVEDLNISVGDGHGTALRILGGSLNTLGEVNLTHEAQWSDTTSIGLHVIWSDVIAETVNIAGFSTGVSCEATSTLSISTLSISDNTDVGYSQACTESIIDELITSFGDYGVHSKIGKISIEDWNASSHTNSLLLSDSNARSYIRNWEGSGFTFAAQGEATELFYGTSTINTNLVQVTDAEQYIESSIEITDLSGENTLQGIEVNVHEFYEVSDANGLVTLPLVSKNSEVFAFDSVQAISRVKSLSTNDVNPKIELPVLPSDGSDWVIESGVNIVLTDFNGVLPSNITIEDGGRLELDQSTLTAVEVTVESYGILTGTDSTFIANNFSISSSEIGSSTASLILDGTIEILCEEVEMTWHEITLKGDVALVTNNNCILYLFGGGLIGQTNISQGGSIVQFSNLVVNVVDEGEPIAFASVSLNGAQGINEITSTITDLTGTAYLRAKSVTYNETGTFEDIDLDRIVTMEIDSLEISQTNYWDVSYNSEMTFVASTVNTDEVFNYLNLELQWSPYYLFDDLVVSGLMEIDNGVDLQISTNKEITVSGQLNIGSASLHGIDWSGILVDGGEINLEGTYLLNAIQSLTLENFAIAEISEATLSNSIDGHLILNSGSSANIEGSSFELGDNCIKTSDDAQISLTIEFSNISLCNVGIRATGAQINLNEVIMYTSGAGIRIIDVSGSMSNISIDGDFTIYDGPNNPPISVISDMSGIEILDQINELLISNIYIDMQSVALSIEDSIGVQLTSLDVSNIRVIRTSGTITNLISQEINVDDSRPSDTIILEQVVGTYLNASGNSGQSCISLISSIISEISLNDICMNMHEGEVNDLLINSTYESQSSLESTLHNSISVNGLAELTLAHIHYFVATLDNSIIDANFALSWENSDNSYIFTGEQNYSVIWQIITSNEIIDLSNATLITTYIGAMPNSASINLGPSFTIPLIELETNPSPIVTLIMPEGLDHISQGATITSSGVITEVNYTATDNHGIASIMWLLVNLDTFEESTVTSDSAYALSELTEGEYSLSIIVTDSYGAMTVVTQLFTITPPDNDAVNIASCISGLWYDDLNQRHCGPDNVDNDDDNDGVSDTIDSFPFDSCASQDTDSDGNPDNLLENCETILIEDDDDDGNGIIDTQEASLKGEKDSGNGSIIIWALLLLIITGALFRRFKSSEV